MAARDTAGLGTGVAEGDSRGYGCVGARLARPLLATSLCQSTPSTRAQLEMEKMNRFFASIAGLAFMTTANVALADCISTCEANCLFGDPGQIGLCIAACPSACTPIPVPACTNTGSVNGCSSTAVVVTPRGVSGYRLSNDGSGGSATAFMTLRCSNFGVEKTAFKGSRTVSPGTTSGIGCIVNQKQYGASSSSTCGINDTCLTPGS